MFWIFTTFETIHLTGFDNSDGANYSQSSRNPQTLKIQQVILPFDCHTLP